MKDSRPSKSEKGGSDSGKAKGWSEGRKEGGGSRGRIKDKKSLVLKHKEVKLFIKWTKIYLYWKVKAIESGSCV